MQDPQDLASILCSAANGPVVRASSDLSVQQIEHGPLASDRTERATPKTDVGIAGRRAEWPTNPSRNRSFSSEQDGNSAGIRTAR